MAIIGAYADLKDRFCSNPFTNRSSTFVPPTERSIEVTLGNGVLSSSHRAISQARSEIPLGVTVSVPSARKRAFRMRCIPPSTGESAFSKLPVACADVVNEHCRCVTTVDESDLFVGQSVAIVPDFCARDRRVC